MLRKNSNEVRVHLSDSEDRGKYYWNFRDGSYQKKGRSYLNKTDSLCTCSRTHKCGSLSNPNSLSEPNSLSIQFNLNETQKITGEQKRLILDILTSREADLPVIDSENGDNSKSIRNWDLSNNLLPLLALLAFLAFISIVAGVSGTCY